jgi:enoyl-CoA hydratase/carnithine racemase
MAQNLKFDVTDGIATMTLNRPEKLNAFTLNMRLGLLEMLDECDRCDDVRVAILTGTGRGFCTGGDTSKMGDVADNHPHAIKENAWRNTQAFAKRIAQFEKPIIAAVNGIATGGGMDMALGCDIRVAAASARFAETYAKMGLVPGGGGGYFLPRIVGKARALELLWTADFIDADEALKIGLVNHVYPDDALMAETTKLAARIAAMPPLSIRLIKRTVNQSLTTDLMASLDLISSHLAIVRAGHDHPEAVSAYREKRKGDYLGY